MNSIFCLGGGVESLPIIQHVFRLGYRPIVFDANEQCAVVRWIDSTWPIDANSRRKRNFYIRGQDGTPVFVKADAYHYDANNSSVIVAWRDASRRRGYSYGYGYDVGVFELGSVRGVLCCAIDAPMTQARVAGNLRLPTIGVSAAQFGVNKFWQYERLKQNNVLVPDTLAVSPESPPPFDEGVVKPVDSRGARGVLRFIHATFRDCCVESLSHSRARQIIAQRWLPGRQLSAESVIWNYEVRATSFAGRNYSRLSETYPYVVEDGSDTVILADAEKKAVHWIIGEACKALRWGRCTVKSDVILNDDGVWIVELAPRLSGGYFASHITPLNSGWDFIADAVSIAAGEEPEVKRGDVEMFVSQRFVFPTLQHIGKRIVSLPVYPASDVAFQAWYRQCGDIIQPVTDHTKRLGQVIAVGRSSDEAREKAVAAVNRRLEGIEVE